VDILYLLIPLSLVLAVLVMLALWWAIHSGQFEDLEGPATRILMDDEDRIS
jgi:cbb3-type cytochrome oxidase maturation protein